METETHPLVVEIIRPQFELIVALSGLERAVEERKNFYDRHHNFFPKHEYKTRTEKAFREIFTMTLWRPDHEDLHHALPSPDHPTQQEMKEILEFYEA